MQVLFIVLALGQPDKHLGNKVEKLRPAETDWNS